MGYEPLNGWWSHPAQWNLQQWADWLRTRERYTPMCGGVHFHRDEECARSESNYVQAAPVPGVATLCPKCAKKYAEKYAGEHTKESTREDAMI